MAVTEPKVQLAPDARLSVRRGASVLVGTGKPLYDYFTLANLLQPCAALVSPATNAYNLVNATIAASRCSALKANGLVTGTTTAEQAASAMNELIKAGWQPESNVLQASHYSFATLSVGLTYANTYGRFSVKDNLCGFSFAATGTTGAPTAANAAALAASFGASNGVPPTIGINIVNNLSAGGPLLDAVSLSAGGVQDYNIAGALCMRELATGTSANAVRVQQGMGEVVRSANLRGKPALIVQGRADTLLPVALTGRPYYGMNKIVEGTASRLSYIRGDQCPAFRRLPHLPGLSGTHAAAAPLLHPGNGHDVCQPQDRRRAAGQPGGAHRAARPDGRCGQSDHGRQRAADPDDARCR